MPCLYQQGIFCPSLGANFGPSQLFSQYHVCFSQLRKVKKKYCFFTFFRDHYYLWETLTHIRMILKHLCLSGMLGIIQSKITWFWGYILLPLLCSMSLISPNFDVKSIIFSKFWPGAFSQNCWKKSPDQIQSCSWDNPFSIKVPITAGYIDFLTVWWQLSLTTNWAASHWLAVVRKRGW